ncbi:glycosyltransferase involved in cell wall biosynthesis [Novosphingobium sp. SG751A]|uniref:glycosyltransferase family 4 protein n=1 Tax=Novosphingobium sp. SG751A TaxID=2587000 RepID=UPI001C12A3DF|nr:glycosyltransferase family 4 protein [Novosphingobium sp. SG751A]NOW46456.1 glycosyltransferase involved in cell wall biosynthesis [Novosphingobium sp. SG751A]
MLLAEIANPDMVSVPLIGWCIAQALSRQADVHLVTHIRNRDAITALGWQEGRDFTVIDTEAVVRAIFRVARSLGASDNRGWTIYQALAPIGCYAFERAVWKRFGQAIEAGEYDIVHRLTPMSPTTPSWLAGRLRRTGVPLVVGPWNGGLPWPAGFAARMMREREGLSALRGVYKWLPGYTATRRHAAAILAGSLHTLSELPSDARARSFHLPENGIDPTRFNMRRTRRARAPLRGVFIGRLVPYKCADVLIEAAYWMLRRGDLHLDIIGDGPDRGWISELVRTLDLEDAVTLHGQVEHREIQSLLVECDFLACPSIREFGGGVVLEAMALGVAPIVADYGGPVELMNDETGIRVPFSGQHDLMTGFRAAMERALADPAMLDRLGNAAAERVAQLFTWERKARQIIRLYDWVRQGGTPPALLLATA